MCSFGNYNIFIQILISLQMPANNTTEFGLEICANKILMKISKKKLNKQNEKIN